MGFAQFRFTLTNHFPFGKPGWCSVSLHIRIRRVSLDDTLNNASIAPNLRTETDESLTITRSFYFKTSKGQAENVCKLSAIPTDSVRILGYFTMRKYAYKGGRLDR